MLGLPTWEERTVSKSIETLPIRLERIQGSINDQTIIPLGLEEVFGNLFRKSIKNIKVHHFIRLMSFDRILEEIKRSNFPSPQSTNLKTEN